MFVRGKLPREFSLSRVRMNIFTEHNQVGLQTQGRERVRDVCGNVSVCVPLHSVTCSISFSAAGPCNKSVLEEKKKNSPPNHKAACKHKREAQSYFLGQDSTARVMGLLQVANLSVYIETVVHKRGVSLNSL